MEETFRSSGRFSDPELCAKVYVSRAHLPPEFGLTVSEYWFDIGRPERYRKAEVDLSRGIVWRRLGRGEENHSPQVSSPTNEASHYFATTPPDLGDRK
jgi:NDP-sugar pyrophosphorylase family protein